LENVDFLEISNLIIGNKAILADFKDYTWHHSHDGKTMVLVPPDLQKYKALWRRCYNKGKIRIRNPIE